MKASPCTKRYHQHFETKEGVTLFGLNVMLVWLQNVPNIATGRLLNLFCFRMAGEAFEFYNIFDLDLINRKQQKMCENVSWLLSLYLSLYLSLWPGQQWHWCLAGSSLLGVAAGEGLAPTWETLYSTFYIFSLFGCPLFSLFSLKSLWDFFGTHLNNERC